MNEPRLPFCPEPLPALRARYRAALVRVFDCRRRLPNPLPSELRGHLFDFEDGLRLSISRERISQSEQVLHLSASYEPGYPLGKQLKRRHLSVPGFLILAERRFAKLSGDQEPLTFLAFTPGKGVPHWHRREQID